MEMAAEIEGRAFDSSVLYWTGYLEAAFNLAFVRALRAPKVMVSRWRTLSVLAELSGITINELAAHSFIERSALSRLLTQLVGEGLVERRPRQDDRRTIEIHLTAKGRAAFEAMLPLRRALFQDASRGIPSADIARLLKTVRALIDNIEGAQARPLSRRPSARRAARG
jgi:DNA-binding MarR family transcriptional regulator